MCVKKSKDSEYSRKYNYTYHDFNVSVFQVHRPKKSLFTMNSFNSDLDIRVGALFFKTEWLFQSISFKPAKHSLYKFLWWNNNNSKIIIMNLLEITFAVN